MAYDTVAGPIVLTPTINAIGVISRYTGDDNANNQAVLEYREAGAPDWKAWDLIGVARASKEWRGSIFPVRAGTAYEVQAVYADPDGVTQGPAVSVTTLSSDLPKTDTGRTLYASPAGTGSGSSPSTPARFSSLLSALQAGDTVLCLEGDYYGLNRIAASGLPDSYITIMPYAGPVRFHGSDPGIAAGVPWSLYASGVYSIPLTTRPGYVSQGDKWLYPYISLADLQAPKWPEIPGGWFWDGARLYIRTVDGTNPSGQNIHVVLGTTIRLFNLAGNYIRLTGLEIGHSIRGVETLNSTGLIIDHCLIHSCHLGFNGAKGSTASQVRIEDNEFGNTISPDWPWLALSGREPSPVQVDRREVGIAFAQPAGVQNVIRHNRIHGWWDGIAYSAWGQLDNPALCRDVDIYENEIWDCLDDPIEVEGGLVNSRVWGNLTRSCLNGYAPSPVRVGPHYFLWNRMVDFRSTMFKLGPTGKGLAFFLHNTGYSERASANGITDYGGAGVANHIFYNNIIRVGRYVVELGNYPVILDYNLYFTTDPSRFIKFGSLYASLAAFQAATGQEAHGIQADPRLVDPTGGDFTPGDGSPAIDAGMVVPGANDGYLGSAPDMGAVETGLAPAPPSIQVAANPVSGYVPLPVQFTLVNSGGPIASWDWDFGDGGTSSEVSPSHTYTAPGDYTVRLVVNGPGGSDDEAITITVLEPTPTPVPVGKILLGASLFATLVALLRRR